MKHLRAALALIAVTAVLIAGCSYTTTSRLPGHIHSVSVGVFGNSTHYVNLEGKLTNSLVRELNLSPGCRVVNDGADAELSGEITKIRNVVIEYDANNQPKEMQVSVSVRYSLYDKVANEFLITNRVVQNTQASTLAGRYSVDTGDGWTSAADAAMAEAARLIVRQIMVMK